MNKKSKCILCDYEGEFKIKLSINGHDIIECPNCSFQFMDVLPTDEEIENIYKKDILMLGDLEMEKLKILLI